MTKIAELISEGQTYSYEFFPPKTAEQTEALEHTLDELSYTEPDFVSVTCGALGATQEYTKEVVTNIQMTRDYSVMPHLTCVGQSKTDINKTLSEYAESGVTNILALRGDGQGTGDFGHAADLVARIKESHPGISVGVAAHPEVHPNSVDRATDRSYLAQKLQVADFAITQFFFKANYYAQLIDELEDLDCFKPVIPGVILFNNTAGLQRIAQMNNTVIPSKLVERLEVTKPADIGKLAVETAVKLIEKLESYAIPGLHIYTMNKSEAALELYDALYEAPGAYDTH